jgi:hypothetical protein
VVKTGTVAPPPARPRVPPKLAPYAPLLGVLACGGLAYEEPFDPPPPPDLSGALAPVASPPAVTQPDPSLTGSGAPSPGQAPPTATARPPTEALPSAGSAQLPNGTRLSCAGGSGSMFSEMRLNEPHDFIALRAVDSTETRYQTDAQGSPCSSAEDRVRCEGQVAEAWPTPNSEWRECSQTLCSYLGIVITRGDDVTIVATGDGLLDLLGWIDNEYEAAVWARANGYPAGCDNTRFVRREDGDYLLEIHEPASGCSTGSVRLIQVFGFGAIIERAREDGMSTLGCSPPPRPPIR